MGVGFLVWLVMTALGEMVCTSQASQCLVKPDFGVLGRLAANGRRLRWLRQSILRSR
jgi:L-asparagine transporter-like permease